MSPTPAEISRKASPVFRKYGFKRVGIFGSRARGTARADSDFDLLYKPGRTMGLFEKMQAQKELEEMLGARVDLVPDSGVAARMRPSIRQDLQVIYEG